MDPPPLPTATTTANPPSSTAATSVHLSYPDSSFESSPRSRAAAESWVPPPPPSDDPLPPVPGGGKLRLMCSYGGHIVPRPHDKSLCYVGGDTRIVVVDRGSSLSDLCSRLSKTLLHGRAFTLKYQLPSEDLDSLISVTTDEDLDNMIDEYDRTAVGSPLRPSRLRLFLFFVKPETAASMGALLDDAKSETWFVDALNGSGLLPRGLSDSAVEDCLLSLDGVRASDSCNDLEAQGNSLGDINKQVAGKALNAHESLHYGFSAPDSPLVENNSSFGSSSSSPSMSNLPPIRVRVVDDQKPGSIEEQFAQITFAPPAQMINTAVSAAAPQPSNPGDSESGVSGDERSDHGGNGGTTVWFRKPPLPLQPVQPKSGGGGSGGGGGYGLPSPDSVASDTSSIASASSHSKPVYYQDQTHHHHHPPPVRDTRSPASPNTTNESVPDPLPVSVPGTHLLQQSKDQGGCYLDHHHHHHPHPHQQIQQQYVPAGAQYMHQQSPIPMSPYYQVYPQTPQQFHHPIDQQYQPMYVMSVAAPQTTTQTYNIPDSSSPVVPTTRPAPGTASAGMPPVYPAKAASPAPPQISPNQFPQHYVGYSQISHHHPHPSQSFAGAQNYAFEYANPGTATPHEQVFYAAPTAMAAPMPSQYQSMTPAAAIALSEAAKQLPSDNNNNNNTQQQMRPSQPQ